MNIHKRALTAKAFYIIFMIVSFFLSCARILHREAGGPKESMYRVVFSNPSYQDDMDPSSLLLAIERNESYLRRLDKDLIFSYGPDSVTAERLLSTMTAFKTLLKKGLTPEELSGKIKEDFVIYKAAGRAVARSVLFTGYYEPILEGSFEPDSVFRYPIYGKPNDLITIDLSVFKDKFAGEKIAARIEGERVVPYFTRAQIDTEGLLSGRASPIAWLNDPVDVAFLQIQGSGMIRLRDGNTLKVGYQASNGRPYRSIGRYLIQEGYLTLEAMSMQAIRRCLAEHPDIVQDTLNYNESYVFFRVIDDGPLGSLDVPLTPGRSIALDQSLFPKAALCFMKARKPAPGSKEDSIDWIPFSRFVLNQDTGGAIKGTGRADLFWGNGPYAELAAGHMRQDGELFFILLNK